MYLFSGHSLFEFCRGIDSRVLNLAQDRKSVSAEINYGIRFETEEDAKKFLAQLSEEVNHYVVNSLFDKLRAIAYL